MHIMNALICTFHWDYCHGGEGEGGGVASTSMWICGGVDREGWVNQVQPLNHCAPCTHAEPLGRKG